MIDQLYLLAVVVAVIYLFRWSANKDDN